MFLTPPVALILSIIGCTRPGHRVAAIAGIVISIAALVMFFVLPLVVALCRS